MFPEARIRSEYLRGAAPRRETLPGAAVLQCRSPARGVPAHDQVGALAGSTSAADAERRSAHGKVSLREVQRRLRRIAQEQHITVSLQLCMGALEVDAQLERLCHAATQLLSSSGNKQRR